MLLCSLRTYVAKILGSRFEQSGGEGAGIGPHFDRVVRVADAPFDAVDDEVGVELGGDSIQKILSLSFGSKKWLELRLKSELYVNT